MFAFAFLGAGATQAADAHFRVTFVRDLFSERGRSVLDAISLLMSLVFMALFTYGAVRLALFSWQLGFRTSTILSIPLWPLQLLMAVGGLLLFAATFRDFLMLVVHGNSTRDARTGTGEVI